MPVYFSNFKKPGTLKFIPGAPWHAVGFAFAPDSVKNDGVALPAGPDADGRQLWKLVVGKQELPGRFVLADGVFTPAEW